MTTTMTWDQLSPNLNNIRGNPLVDVEALAQSIAESGLIQPIVVDAEGTIIAGHRRYEAYRMLIKQGRVDVTVPIPVHRLSARTESDTVAMLVENIQRVNLDPVDEAAAYRRLLLQDLSVADIAVAVGRSETVIYRRLPLLNLLPEIQEALRAEDITLAQADQYVQLLNFDPAHTHTAFEHGYTLAQLTRMVDQLWLQEHLRAMAEAVRAAGGVAYTDYTELTAAGLVIDHTDQLDTDTHDISDLVVGGDSYWVAADWEGKATLYSTTVAPERPESDATVDETKALLTKQRKARLAAAGALLGATKVPAALAMTVVARWVGDHVPPMHARTVVRMLALPDKALVVDDTGDINWVGTVRSLLRGERGLTAQRKAIVALAITGYEADITVPGELGLDYESLIGMMGWVLSGTATLEVDTALADLIAEEHDPLVARDTDPDTAEAYADRVVAVTALVMESAMLLGTFSDGDLTDKAGELNGGPVDRGVVARARLNLERRGSIARLGEVEGHLMFAVVSSDG